MRRIVASIAVCYVLVLAFLLGRSDIALATPNCATHGEVDRLETFMSLSTVREIFDLPGRDEGDSPSGDFYRYSFNACWTEDRVWVWMSYAGFGLDRWDIRP